MSIIATAVRHLMAAGVTGEALIAAIADMEAEQPKDAAAEKRRAWDRQRKAEQRERDRLSTGIPPESADNVDTNPAPDKSPQTPKINPTPREHTHNAGARGAAAWKCPEGVDRQHWTDFLANRRTKRLGFTPTAYRGQLKALDQLSDDDEWPPGRIVQFAAERGWGAFFDPRGRDDGRRQQQRNGQGGSVSGYGRTIDATLDFIADCERGHPC